MTPSDITAKVLHIRSATFNGAVDRVAVKAFEEMDIRLARTGLAVESCADVYRGLALLGRSGAKTFSAAVIAVDGLGPDEMEFFGYAAKACPGLPLLIYGAGPSETKLARALQLGATARVSAEALRSLIGVTYDRPQREEPAKPEPEPVMEELEEEVPVEPEEEEVAFRDEEPSTPSEPPADNGNEPARVPWLRYAGTPVRRPPQRTPAPVVLKAPVRPSSPPTATPSGPARPGDAVHEPLLTDEELRALLSDDDDLGSSGDGGPADFEPPAGRRGTP